MDKPHIRREGGGGGVMYIHFISGQYGVDNPEAEITHKHL